MPEKKPRQKKAAKHPAKKAAPTRAARKKKATEAAPKPRCIVGIGASAGGLAALKRFFAHLPNDSGLTFVVVVHLSPDHESHLAELLQPHVSMPVQQVTKTVRLEPNHVYVIPPNANLNTIDTHLRLSRLEERWQERAPIDHFFRTLADTHDGHAVGIILTGTGSDGTLGLKEIKRKGGLTVTQDPAEAEYDGMPLSATSTGLVDLILPLDRIPEAVTRFARTEPRITVPKKEEDELDPETEKQIERLFSYLKARTGRDFIRYKRSTLLRRIQRRMQMHQMEDVEAYLDLLSATPEEARQLVDDMLITVTSFFRDGSVFEKLEKDVFPKLFEGKGANEEVRIWSVGCATGEEAYSLAILALEEADRHKSPPRIQIFASDLHEPSLKKGREGFFPGDIETVISPERLTRFFTKQSGGYRVRKEVRELVVFAPHNILSTPPFSRINLICCRNLLIYIKRETQRAIVGLFHYALRPDGYLLLGTSETIDGSELFRLIDKRCCLHQKRNVPGPEPQLPVFPYDRARPTMRSFEKAQEPQPVGYPKLHEELATRFRQASILINADDRIAHLSEGAGRFLAHPGGEPTTNIFKLLRDELRIELRATLQAARDQSQPRRSRPIRLKIDGELCSILIRVLPAQDSRQSGFALVVFDQLEPSDGDEDLLGKAVEPSPHGAESRRERELEAELNITRQRLQAIIEEYETSQEEMKASNEEMQSTNEELRSTMEELETSKEALQSMNEELQTVNQENRHKVEELGQLSSDLQNLLAATDIATLFLDRQFRILRFTPKVEEIFNIRVIDKGRPLSDLTSRLGYHKLQEDAKRVINKLVPIEREIHDGSGSWYLCRILPYRSSEDRIEGVVITFVDVTSTKRSEIEVQEARDYAEKIIDTLPEPLLVLDSNLFVKRANASFYDQFEVDPAATIGRRVYDLGNGQWDNPKLRKLLQEVLPENEVFSGYEIEHDFESIGRRAMLLNARQLNRMQLILLGIHDITERQEMAVALRQSEEQHRFLLTLTDALRPISDAIEIQQVAARMVAQRIQASRVHYSEVTPDGQYGIVLADYHTQDVQSVVGRHRFDDFGRAAIDEFRQGRTLIVSSVQEDSRLDAAARKATAKLDIGAYVAVPVVKAGVLTNLLVAHHRQPHAWSPAEIALLEETGERTWAAVERARAEATVRESERRFRALISATSYVVFRMNADWSEMRQMEGRGIVADLPQPTSSWMDQYIVLEDQPRLETAFKEALEQGIPFEVEHRVRRVDGSLGWALTRAAPLKNEKGVITEWFGAASDVTERKRTEEERAKERALLDAILETLPVGIVIADASGRIYRDNAASRELWGVPLQADSWEDYGDYVAWWPESGERIKAEEWAMSRALHEGRSIRNELVLCQKFNSNEKRFYLNNVSPLKNDQGKIVGGVAAMLDVSERLQAERALRRSEDRLSRELAAMTRLHELITRLLVSPNLATALDEVLAATIDIIGTGMGVVQLVNPETGELEIAAKRGLDAEAAEHIALVSSKADSSYRKAVSHGRRSVIEDLQKTSFFERHKDIAIPKTYRAVQSTPLTTRGGETVGVLSTHYAKPHRPSKRDMRILDLYARQATEFIEHVRRREEAKLESQRKDAFLATLAHELRNPLAPIRSGVEVLRQAEGDAAERDQMLSVMDREIRQLVVLVDDLLDVSRITRGKFELKKSRVDLREIAECAIDEAKPLIEEGGHELVWSKPRKPIFLEADRHRLAQVLSNLLTNAAKYTPEPGQIELSIRRRGGSVSVSVKDTGVGIPEDMQESIFEMFTQVDRTHEAGRSGLGIGLTLVKSLAEMHGGTVEVKSAGSNQGSEFIVLLPLAKDAEATEDQPADKPASAQKTKKQRVLVVDDNRSASMTLSLLARKLGHEVKTANDGAAAIEAAREFKPHTILMDIGMPKMDGHEAARRLRKEPWGKKIKLVALTGWGADKDKEAAKEAGFDEHLVKPAEPARLQELLGRTPEAKVDFR